MATAKELDIATVSQGTTALDLAHAIFGEGVEVIDASYVGSSGAAGIYSGASTTIPGISPTDSTAPSKLVLRMTLPSATKRQA